MGEAIRQAADWQRSGHSLSIAVNISTKQLLVGDLVRAPSTGCSVTRTWIRELLILEVTESVLLEDADRAIATMDQLHALGVLDRHRRLRYRLLVAPRT